MHSVRNFQGQGSIYVCNNLFVKVKKKAALVFYIRLQQELFLNAYKKVSLFRIVMYVAFLPYNN